MNGIVQPIIAPIVQPIVGGVAASFVTWNPILLFAAGEQGGWYDPSDLSTLFQDSAGTTPVTASGQPVGLILDKSGRGNNLSNATSTARPFFRIDSNGHAYLDFDGVDDNLNGNMDMSAGDKANAFVALRKMTDAAAGVVFEQGPSGGPVLSMFAPISALSNTISMRSGGTVLQTTATNAASPISAVVTGTGNISGDVVQIRLNGVAATPNTGDQGTGNFSNNVLRIGIRAAGNFAFLGRVYGFIIRGGLASAAQISSAEKWLSARIGVSL